VDVATREWVGMLAYWLAGRSDSLFPAPGERLAAKTRRETAPHLTPIGAEATMAWTPRIKSSGQCELSRVELR
jgi:hypothetical protein